MKRKKIKEIMYTIPIKALSVNQAYQGRRFATPALKAYKQQISMLLLVNHYKEISIPEGKLSVKYEFGVSSKTSDADNLVKAFQDILAEVYCFNDKLIYRIEVEKKDVKKGEEFIGFSIEKCGKI